MDDASENIIPPQQYSPTSPTAPATAPDTVGATPPDRQDWVQETGKTTKEKILNARFDFSKPFTRVFTLMADMLGVHMQLIAIVLAILIGGFDYPMSEWRVLDRFIYICQLLCVPMLLVAAVGGCYVLRDGFQHKPETGPNLRPFEAVIAILAIVAALIATTHFFFIPAVKDIPYVGNPEQVTLNIISTSREEDNYTISTHTTVHAHTTVNHVVGRDANGKLEDVEVDKALYYRCDGAAHTVKGGKLIISRLPNTHLEISYSCPYVDSPLRQ
ncbi:hypothetical protein OCH74_00940 [Bifidobacterium thermacidophilum]|uniref:Uncharacterized protein n=1 Tax=Bifidobacterium thermacidophilum TaxID=246618 RepID=A0ABW8KPD8_9BIFI